MAKIAMLPLFVLFISSGYCEPPNANQSNVTSTDDASNQTQGQNDAIPPPIAASASKEDTPGNNLASNNLTVQASLSKSKISSADAQTLAPEASKTADAVGGKAAAAAGTASGNNKVDGWSGIMNQTGKTTISDGKSMSETLGKVVPDTATKDQATTAIKLGQTSAKDSLPAADSKTTELPPPAKTTRASSIGISKEKQTSDAGGQKAAQISNQDETEPEIGDGDPRPIVSPAYQSKGADLGVEVDDDDLVDAPPRDRVPSQKAAKEVADADVKPKIKEPEVTKQQQYSRKMSYEDEPENSHFLAYLLTIGVLCVAAYLVAHNRHKLMGLILEGRKGRRTQRSGSTSGRGVKYKQLQHEDEDGENGLHFSSQDGGRVIY